MSYYTKIEVSLWFIALGLCALASGAGIAAIVLSHKNLLVIVLTIAFMLFVPDGINGVLDWLRAKAFHYDDPNY